MNKKKVLKITALVIGSLVLVFIGLASFVYYDMHGKYPENENKYPHYIGYLNPETTLLNDEKLCDEGKIYSTHHGAPEYAYAKNKKHFRETIMSEYNSEEFQDSGYLNFRFLVNCQGRAGWFEINEMDLNLAKTNLNDELVGRLLELTANEKHWNTLTIKGESKNYYMYILYRIENGKITEILP